jgi:hypothetical protein
VARERQVVGERELHAPHDGIQAIRLGTGVHNLAIFMEYAQSDGWIAIHFAQWSGVLLLFADLAINSATHGWNLRGR